MSSRLLYSDEDDTVISLSERLQIAEYQLPIYKAVVLCKQQDKDIKTVTLEFVS